jgi:hypothetical protein
MNRFDSIKKTLMWFLAMSLVALVTGCGGDSTTPKPAPTSPGAGTGLNGAGAGPAPVVLGSVIGTGVAGTPNYVVLAKTAVTTTGATIVTGDVGISPNGASSLQGFSESLDAAKCYATSTYVVGYIYAADFQASSGCLSVPDTASLLTTAVGNMQTAYTDAAGRPADFTEIGAGNIGGMTLPPGTYKWGSGVLIPANVTLDGSANDVWIFQIAGGITQASGTSVNLTGGAVSKNVFWQVADVVDIGTTAHMAGVLLAQTQITLKTGATVDGRLLAQTQVTLQANTVTEPAP